MDYVSNNITIVKDQRADRGAVILAYDMAFTKLKKSMNSFLSKKTFTDEEMKELKNWFDKIKKINIDNN